MNEFCFPGVLLFISNEVAQFKLSFVRPLREILSSEYPLTLPQLER